MRVFLISLKRSVERRSQIINRLSELGVEFTLIEAVDGELLTAEEKKKAVRNFVFWCYVGRSILNGEIGCAMSHANVYRRFLNDRQFVDSREKPCFCVIEDDAIIYDGFLAALSKIEENIDTTRPQVILLSNHDNMKMFAEGYVITALAAEAIIKANTPMLCPCDYWWLWEKQGRIEVFHHSPPLLTQDIHQTTIGRTKALSQMSIIEKCIWKMKRAIGLSIVGIMALFNKNGAV